MKLIICEHIMSFRFVDLDSRPSPARDFCSRKRSPGLTDQFLICLTLILTAVATLMLIHNEPMLISILFIIIGLAAVYVTTQTNRNRDLLQVTEFQNALFATALAKDYSFCLIAGNEGSIIYCNVGFAALFPNVPIGANVKEWLIQGKVSQSDSASVLESIGKDHDRELTIRIVDGGQKAHALVLCIETIRRPGTFFLLRGRESEGA